MSGDVVIRVEGIGKMFHIGHQQSYKALRDTLSDWAMAPLRFMRNLATGHSQSQATHEDFWALKDVSFNIKRGEAVGLIGCNGAGKSTLLKILSRITEPTTGRVQITGRVGCLLEVGTGFHPELTGRENIFLYGAILGMKRREILENFDRIVAFSETERFLDTPIKHYSSGMYTRLAFSVAAHLEPEILLVDEVLAVGDAAFQKKCLGRMDEFGKSGRTVVFVSHTLGMIKQLCSLCLRLESGVLTAYGDANSVVDDYVSDLYERSGGVSAIEEQLVQLSPDPDLKILDFRVTQDGLPTLNLSSGKNTNIEIEYELFNRVEGFHIYIQVAKPEGLIILESLHDGQLDQMRDQEAGRYRSTATIPANFLNESRYVITLLAGIHNIRRCLHPDLTVTVDVFRDGIVNSTYPAYKSPGLLLVDCQWRTRDLATGAAWPSEGKENSK